MQHDLPSILPFLHRIMLVVTVVAAVVAVATAEQTAMLVTLKQGAILGSLEEATNGRTYYSFKSIPYARPPIGPLRFKVRGNAAAATNCANPGHWLAPPADKEHE